MLRITKMEDMPQRTILKLEGRLIEPWVDLLAQTCGQCQHQRGTSLVVDLGNVTFASRNGLELLHRLQNEGVDCIAWSPLLKTLAQNFP